jgi:hypothetical protein
VTVQAGRNDRDTDRFGRIAVAHGGSLFGTATVPQSRWINLSAGVQFGWNLSTSRPYAAGGGGPV